MWTNTEQFTLIIQETRTWKQATELSNMINFSRITLFYNCTVNHTIPWVAKSPLLIWRQTDSSLKMVFNIINFATFLPITYIKSLRGYCRRLPRCLLRHIQRFIRLLWQKKCWGTAEVNDVFKLVSQQLHCQQLYS